MPSYAAFLLGLHCLPIFESTCSPVSRMKRVKSTNLDWDTFLAHKSEFPEAWTLDHSHWQALSASQCSEPVWSAVQFHKLQNTERHNTITQTQGQIQDFWKGGSCV